MSRRNNTNAVLSAIAIFSVCILLVIVAWHYIFGNGIKNANASETVYDNELSRDDVPYNEVSSGTPTQKPEEPQTKPDIKPEEPKETGEYQYSQIVTEFVTGKKNNGEYVDTSLEQKYIIMKELLQLPSLPTGCEITSLTAVLNYWGYGVSKETMADKYLEKGKLGQVTAYEAFIGMPSSTGGYGCFAPVIQRAANKYLSDFITNGNYRTERIHG